MVRDEIVRRYDSRSRRISSSGVPKIRGVIDVHVESIRQIIPQGSVSLRYTDECCRYIRYPDRFQRTPTNNQLNRDQQSGKSTKRSKEVGSDGGSMRGR